MTELRDEWGVSTEEAEIGSRHIAVAILIGLSLPTWAWVAVGILAWAGVTTVSRALDQSSSAGLSSRQRAGFLVFSFASVGGLGLLVAALARFAKLAIVAAVG